MVAMITLLIAEEERNHIMKLCHGRDMIVSRDMTIEVKKIPPILAVVQVKVVLLGVIGNKPVQNAQGDARLAGKNIAKLFCALGCVK